MYLFSSASQICAPCPRTMNGGSPPTERNARTGELTPPGIICSARFCSLLETSTLRVMIMFRGTRYYSSQAYGWRNISETTAVCCPGDESPAALVRDERPDS